MKKLILLFSIILFTSCVCDSPIYTSVNTPLTEDQKKEIFSYGDKYNSYHKVFEISDKIRESITFESERIKYSIITYSSLNDYLNGNAEHLPSNKIEILQDYLKFYDSLKESKEEFKESEEEFY